MLVFKLSYRNDTRRIALDSAPEYETFKMLVRTMFSIPDQQNFSLSYCDEEGDTITVTTNMELDEAVRVHQLTGAASLKIVVSESTAESSNIFSFVPVEASLVSLPAEASIPHEPEPLSETEAVCHISPASADTTIPTSAPEPIIEATPSTVAPPAASRELTVLDSLEKQLQEAFRAVKTFMRTLDIDVKILDAFEGAQRTFKSATDTVEKEVIDPLAALTKAKADDFTQQLSKLEQEILRIKDQIKTELSKAANSISNRFSPPPVAQPASPLPSEQELQDLADKFARSDEPVAPVDVSLPATAALQDLQRLAEMGFTDRKKNLVLLAKHSGNLIAVVEELIK